jgi:hypothetical protein
VGRAGAQRSAALRARSLGANEAARLRQALGALLAEDAAAAVAAARDGE